MNSKQALDHIKHMADWEYYNIKGDILPIEKDLEILDIIKKWSFIQENYKDGYGKFTQFLCNIHTIGMKEDFEKIKEWLEDE